MTLVVGSSEISYKDYLKGAKGKIKVNVYYGFPKHVAKWGKSTDFKSESYECDVRSRLKSLFFILYYYLKNNKKAGLIPAFIFYLISFLELSLAFSPK